MKSNIFNIFKLTIKDWKQRKWKSHNGLKNRKPNSYLNTTPIAIKGNAGQNRWHNQFSNTLLCWVITILYRKYKSFDLVSSKILERESNTSARSYWDIKEWSLELCCVTYGIWYLIQITCIYFIPTLVTWSKTSVFMDLVKFTVLRICYKLWTFFLLT